VPRLSTALLLLVGACSHSQDGPAPQLQSVMPDLTCGAQHSTRIALTGNGFAPLAAPALGNATVQIPQIILKRGKDLSGQPAADSLTIPNDARNPVAADEEWASEQSMSFSLCPPGTCSQAAVPLTDLPPIPTGLYDVSVATSSGAPSTLPGALGIVGPPSLVQVDPDLVCEDQAAQLTLTGDFMLRVGGTKGGRVELGMMAGVTPQQFDLALSNCRTLAAPAAEQLEACTQAGFGVPAALIRDTSLALFVVNPTPVDCRFEQDPMRPTVSLTFVRSPQVSSVMPSKVCLSVAKQVTLMGAGFLEINGVKPTVKVGGATVTADSVSGCMSVLYPGLRETVLSCTSLVFTLGMGQVKPANYQVTVTNPAPADCTSAGATLTIGPGIC
jgi:hypothetical protein